MFKALNKGAKRGVKCVAVLQMLTVSKGRSYPSRSEVWEWVLRSRIFDTCSSSWNRGFHEFSHISAYIYGSPAEWAIATVFS